MINELVNNEMCVYMRNGIEIWAPEEKARELGEDLFHGRFKGIAKIEGQYVNPVEIVGIFTPDKLEDLKRRKMGEHKCKYGTWHTKDEECSCGRQTGAWTPPIVDRTPGKNKEEFLKKRDELVGARPREDSNE